MLAMSNTYAAVHLNFVRHGQARADDGLYGPDTPLSELGQRQARALANHFEKIKTFTAVYTSPLPRAVETANPLCAALGLQAIVDSRLREFEMRTAPIEAVEKRPDLVLWQPHHCGFENGEALSEFCVRVGDFCDEIATRHLGQR